MLDGLSRTGELLNLVKNDHALARCQLRIVRPQQIHEKDIKLLKIILEEALNLL